MECSKGTRTQALYFHCAYWKFYNVCLFAETIPNNNWSHLARSFNSPTGYMNLSFMYYNKKCDRVPKVFRGAILPQEPSDLWCEYKHKRFHCRRSHGTLHECSHTHNGSICMGLPTQVFFLKAIYQPGTARKYAHVTPMQ